MKEDGLLAHHTRCSASVVAPHAPCSFVLEGLGEALVPHQTAGADRDGLGLIDGAAREEVDGGRFQTESVLDFAPCGVDVGQADEVEGVTFTGGGQLVEKLVAGHDGCRLPDRGAMPLRSQSTCSRSHESPLTVVAPLLR